jgi:hypothetical protein
MVGSNILLIAGLILLLALGLNARRIVKARNISGVVVMGDVHGDITQTQTPQPIPPAQPLWKDLLTLTNAVLGIAASAMVIVSQFFS